MDDTTPATPGQTPPVSVPNPHADAPVPSPQDGMRPEAAVNPAVRPEQDEPGGPLGGLVGTAATQASAEATPTGSPQNEADAALLESMGVESEGIESGQILGLVAATILSVAALAVVLIFLFYIPFRQQVGETASDVPDYPELAQVRTEAAAKLGQYARADSLYQVPIGQAMTVVAGRYGATGTAPAGQPATRQQWNTLMLNRGTGTAVQNPTGLARRTTVEQERLAAASAGEVGASRTASSDASRPANAPALVPPPAVGRTNDEVGVDDNVRRPAPTTLGDAQTD